MYGKNSEGKPGEKNYKIKTVSIAVDEEYLETEGGHVIKLLVTQNASVDKPSLSEEIRAQADLKHFGMRASLLLNNSNISTCDIIRSLLRKMFQDNNFKNRNQEQLTMLASQALFIRNVNGNEEFLQFFKIIQGFDEDVNGVVSLNSSWLICMATLPEINKRIVGITTLLRSINMGGCSRGVNMVMIVLTPLKQKHFKSDIETGRNMAVILGDLAFRQEVCRKNVTETIFRERFLATANNLITLDYNETLKTKGLDNDSIVGKTVCYKDGIIRDLYKRLQKYGSDYSDAWISKSTVFRTITSIWFLFFANLLPTIAFGMLNETNTKHKMNVATGILAQLIGGVGYALLGGQHLTVLLTTAPLSIIIFVIFSVSNAFEVDFFSLYAWVGIFNTIYLCVYAVTGLSRIMKFSRRSTEEIFAFFTAIAYILSALEPLIKSFVLVGNGTTKEESVLFLLLLLGTMSFALWLNQYTTTPFLNSFCRSLLSGFALPISVLLMSILRSTLFVNIEMHNFNASSWQNTTLHFARIESLPLLGIVGAASLAVPISILFFMAHNISSSIVNCKSNKLKKSSAYHWDLVILGLLNLLLSMFSLPWLVGAPLHSSLHVQSLATFEENISSSNYITKRVVKVVETRISSILANIMVGACLFMMPYPLLYISSPVLNGIFLYIALRSLQHNQLFERLQLICTEQVAYPPNHYLKRVPQASVHIFTFIQCLQLIAMCAVGFAPFVYLRIFFPLILIAQLPFRHILFPFIISKKYLDALDKTY